MQQTVQKIIGTLLALGVSALTACGPNAQLPENVVLLDLKAISVSKYTDAQGTESTSSVQLSWEGVPGNARKIILIRRTGEQIQNLGLIEDISITTFTDELNLQEGKEYIYNVRADDNNDVTAAKVESKPLVIASPGSIKSFKLTVPENNEQQLVNLGDNIEFQWEDAGTGLYYVTVADTNGNIKWGAVTTKTKIVYGTDSLAIPSALNKEFVISKKSPDSSKSEVQFVGLKSGGKFTISVSAIQTMPQAANLQSAASLAIRPALSVTFSVL